MPLPLFIPPLRRSSTLPLRADVSPTTRNAPSPPSPPRSSPSVNPTPSPQVPPPPSPNATSFANSFRISTAYVQVDHGLIFIIHIPASLLEEPQFPFIMHDSALIHVIGIKLILVLGLHYHLERRLVQQNIPSRYHADERLTDIRVLQLVKHIAGSIRLEVESTVARALKIFPPVLVPTSSVVLSILPNPSASSME